MRMEAVASDAQPVLCDLAEADEAENEPGDGRLKEQLPRLRLGLVLFGRRHALRMRAKRLGIR
jgi:hypothetical protein